MGRKRATHKPLTLDVSTTNHGGATYNELSMGRLWCFYGLHQPTCSRSNGRFGAGGRVPLEPQPGRELWMTGRGDGFRDEFRFENAGTHVSIDWFSREKLQEHPIFHGKIYGFWLRFSLQLVH